MKAVLCKPNEKPKVVDLPKKHDYLDIKALLEIESPISCVSRKIGNAYYDIWCDDEGLFPEKKYASAMLIKEGCREILCGNLLIAKHDGEGNTVGLTPKEREKILDSWNWGNNATIMNYHRQTYGFVNVDENGDMVLCVDYAGFGQVLLHKNGALLKYSI